MLSRRALLMMIMWKFAVRRCLARLRFITNSDFINEVLKGCYFGSVDRRIIIGIGVHYSALSTMLRIIG